MKRRSLRRTAGLTAAATVTATGFALATATPAHADGTLAPQYAGQYSISTLGTPPGIPTNLGGITLKAGDPNTLLIGGAANQTSGAIYQIGVIRDAHGHITGWDGSASFYASAPWIDGGLAYAPNGDLLYTAYPVNEIGEIKPGSTSPDKVVTLPADTNSVGALQFVPTGFDGAGDFKIVSYNTGGFYDATLTDDGSGTYDIAVTTPAAANTGGGPEGIAYVPPTSVDFPNPSVLVDLYSQGTVEAYDVDSNGDPVISSARDFITGLFGAEGAHIDSQTNDFIFATYGSANTVIVVHGFGALTCQRMETSPGVSSSFDQDTGVTTFTGTDGDDVIAGTNGKDVINAGGGNDLVCAHKGDDVINGGEGNDQLYGQAGDDQVNGEGGNDKIYGNGQNDTLTGGDGNDKVIGGNGTDTCDGGTGTNVISKCEPPT